jgi:PAS domain S-box-containing protein
LAIKILISEDDSVSRLLLKKVLQKAGYDVIEAENGRVAWSLFLENRINLLITDWVMPEIDGLELIKMIRKQRLDYYVYIIMLTGKENKSSTLEGFNAGADDYITKPYVPDEVLARVRTGYRIVELEDKYKHINHTLEKKNSALEELHSNLTQAALEVSNSYTELKQVFDMSSDGIWVVDTDYTIIRVNDRFLTLIGSGNEDVVGQKCFDIFPGKICKGPDCPLVRVLNGDERVECDIEREVTGKGIIPFILSATPLTGMNNVINGIVVNLKDVSLQKKAMALEKEKIIAEAQNLSKSEFLANMSHEIRTPLNGIIGITEILLDMNLNEKQHELMKTMLTEAESLLRLVNDILDFSKIESGKLELDKQGFDLKTLIEDICRIYSVSSKKKDLDFDCSIGFDIPSNLIGDPCRLRQILNNLLGNALKFTNNGRISLKVFLEEKLQNSIILRFVITDSGIGIPEDQQEKVFERFTQADSSITRNYGGSGLGITISRQLAELMGGTLGLESRVGEGSKFWFTAEFSIDRGQLPYKPSLKAPVISNNTKQCSILLVEDYVTNQEIALRHLSSAGYNADLAENGMKAIEMFRKMPYDIILMDIQMPVMGGFEATKCIRAIENENSVKKNNCVGAVIIAMTAHAISGYRERCIDEGFNDFITKPIRKDSLLAIISYWIEKTPEHAEEYGNEDSDSIITITSNEMEDAQGDNVKICQHETPINLETAINEFEGDEELLFRVADGFLSNVKNQIVKIRKAFEEANPEIIRSEAHAIKGGAANLTAIDLSCVASELESAGHSADFESIPGIMQRFQQEFERLDNYISNNQIRG